jgi:hypothetical protein
MTKTTRPIACRPEKNGPPGCQRLRKPCHIGIVAHKMLIAVWS